MTFMSYDQHTISVTLAKTTAQNEAYPFIYRLCTIRIVKQYGLFTKNMYFKLVFKHRHHHCLHRFPHFHNLAQAF